MRSGKRMSLVSLGGVAAALLLVTATGASARNAPWDKSGIKDWAAVPAPGAEPKWQAPKAQHFTLKNGLRVVVIENHRLPVVAFELVVNHAGSAADPAGKAGLASFTADLLDEGTGDLGALAISERLDQLGAEAGFATSSEAAWGSLSSLTRTLDDSFDLWARMITAPAFADAEVKRVHADRMTSLALRRDRPREIASLLLQGALFGPDSAYGHPGAGWAADLGKLGAADARAFYQARWTPANAILVVAGDITRKQLEPRLTRLAAWQGASASDAAQAAVPVPVSGGPRLLVVDRPGAEQTDLRMGLAVFPRTDARYAKFEVLRTILGDGFTSRLVQRLREQLGYTYGIAARVDWRRAPSPFTIASALVSPKTIEGMGEITGIVDALAKTAVPADELDKAKLNIVRAFPQQFETNEGIASAYAELAIFGLPDSWFASYVAAVRKVTAKDVQELAAALLPVGGMKVALVGDLKLLGPGLGKLGLGDAVEFDADGLAPLKKK